MLSGRVAVRKTPQLLLLSSSARVKSSFHRRPSFLISCKLPVEVELLYPYWLPRYLRRQHALIEEPYAGFSLIVIIVIIILIMIFSAFISIAQIR